MMKYIILFVVLVFEISKAQFHGKFNADEDVVWPYISPGIQIGFNSGKGLFYSFQLTVGLIPSESPIIIPGMTIGKRFYIGGSADIAKETYTYKDIQLGIFGGFIGIGDGTMTNSNKSYPKFKFWIAVPLVPLVLISYDYVDFEHKPHHLGFFGVLPVWTNLNFDRWYPTPSFH